MQNNPQNKKFTHISSRNTTVSFIKLLQAEYAKERLEVYNDLIQHLKECRNNAFDNYTIVIFNIKNRKIKLEFETTLMGNKSIEYIVEKDSIPYPEFAKQKWSDIPILSTLFGH
jgi:hypothetical protein